MCQVLIKQKADAHRTLTGEKLFISNPFQEKWNEHGLGFIRPEALRLPLAGPTQI